MKELDFRGTAAWPCSSIGNDVLYLENQGCGLDSNQQ